jgi:demethylmenaquinone methyltransferase/2-methoxy-6-polyprenyl-1,4-benzoquinol methylase
MSTDKKLRTPPEKKKIRAMFNNIASRYDFLNHFLSMGIDKLWRRKIIRILRSFHPQEILDVATGTGDLAIKTARIKPQKIIGVDIAEEMLVVAREKIKKKNLAGIIEVKLADSENLPFENDSFDAVTVAFGVRNFEDLDRGISEMNRVLRPGGKVVILEFSMPQKFPVRQLYLFYFRFILPLVGKIVSKNNMAYKYLPDSVSAFPQGTDFMRIMQNAGFVNVMQEKLSFGIASVYIGEKLKKNNNFAN